MVHRVTIGQLSYLGDILAVWSETAT